MIDVDDKVTISFGVPREAWERAVAALAVTYNYQGRIASDNEDDPTYLDGTIANPVSREQFAGGLVLKYVMDTAGKGAKRQLLEQFGRRIDQEQGELIEAVHQNTRFEVS